MLMDGSTLVIYAHSTRHMNDFKNHIFYTHLKEIDNHMYVLFIIVAYRFVSYSY
jgi:hypothetical protein